MTHVPFQSDPNAVWHLLGHIGGDVAFDVGANGGVVAEALARKFTAVHAFEPCKESYDDLVDAALPGVVAHPVALSAETGDLTLSECRVTGTMGELVTGDSLSQFAWGAITGQRVVDAMTLDDAAGAFGVPDFVKVDTEGHEVEVIRGGLTTLQDAKPMLLIEVHAEANGPAIVELLPEYLFLRIDHDAYRPGTYSIANHFYLVGVPR